MANRIADNLKINHKALDSNLKENSSETKMRDTRYEILYDELDDDDNPTASAFFGRYRGHDQVIFWQEKF